MEILILPIWLSFISGLQIHIQTKKERQNYLSLCQEPSKTIFVLLIYFYQIKDFDGRFAESAPLSEESFCRWSRRAISVIFPETPHWRCLPSLPWSCTGCSSLPLGLSTWPGVLRIPGKHLNLSSRCTISFFRNKSKQLQMFFTDVLFQPDLVDACSKDSQCWMVSWFCNPMYTIYKIIYIVCMHTIYDIIKKWSLPKPAFRTIFTSLISSWNMLQALIPFYAVLFIALGLLSLMAALTGTFDHTVAKGLNMFNRSLS